MAVQITDALMLGETSWWVLFISWMLAGAWFDLRDRRVPNTLVLLALFSHVVLLAASAWTGTVLPGASGWLAALAGLAAGLAFIVFWKIGQMGAGDVKFLAVLGFWVGPGPLCVVLLAGGLLSWGHALAYTWSFLRTRSQGKPHTWRGIPYAGYLALGALSVALMQWNSRSCSWFSLQSCTPF